MRYYGYTKIHTKAEDAITFLGSGTQIPPSAGWEHLHYALLNRKTA